MYYEKYFIVNYPLDLLDGDCAFILLMHGVLTKVFWLQIDGGLIKLIADCLPVTHLEFIVFT